jgi:16S rRNA G966 N2-methylase RsmD
MKTNKNNNIGPCMSDIEINIFHFLLQKYKPKKCLEWGAGRSTIEYSKYEFIQLWTTIESEIKWINIIKNKVDTNKVKIIHLQNDLNKNITNNYNLDKKRVIDEYINCKDIDTEYDFIFIDGSHRIQCLEKSSSIMSRKGICLLHDSSRFDVSKLKYFKFYKILTEGEKNKNGDCHQGLTVFWNDPDINI